MKILKIKGIIGLFLFCFSSAFSQKAYMSPSGMIDMNYQTCTEESSRKFLENPTEHNMSQANIGESKCADDVRVSYDRLMNVYYRMLLDPYNGMSEQNRQKIKNEQVAWLNERNEKFRTIEKDTLWDSTFGWEKGVEVKSNSKMNIVKERVIQLEEYCTAEGIDIYSVKW